MQDDPYLKTVMKALIVDPPFHGFLKPEPVSVDKERGEVVVRLPYNTDLTRSKADGVIHGGVIATLVDMAGHAVVALAIGRMAPTIDLRVDYISSAGPEDLIVTATLIRAGRSVARADVTVKGASGKLVALGRGTFSSLEPQG